MKIRRIYKNVQIKGQYYGPDVVSRQLDKRCGQDDNRFKARRITINLFKKTRKKHAIVSRKLKQTWILQTLDQHNH